MARHPKRSRSKRRLPKHLPVNLHDLTAAGGPETLARNAAAKAAATVASQEREFWLGFVEGINQDGLNLQDRALCSMYIRDLRRKLGIGQSKEMIREQTRLRVRRLRERRRAQDQHPSDQEPVVEKVQESVT